MKKYRSLIILCVTVAVLALVGWQVVSYIHSFQKVTITYSSADISGVKLYQAVVQNGSTRVTGQSLRDITSSTTYKLKKGLYILRPSGEKIDTDDIPLTLGSSPVNKTLALDYSQEYLSTLQTTEQPQIEAALQASNSGIAPLYKINDATFYRRGEWAGVTLSYKGTDTLSRDTLRAILQHKDGAWQVVTNPPQITLSAKDYSLVPTDVISAVNAIDIGAPVIATP